MNSPGIRVSGWSVLSPVGIGTMDFSRAVAEGTVGRARIPVGATGGVDRLSAIALVASHDLLDARQTQEPGWGERTAIVLGTSTGSLPRLVEMAYDSHNGRRGHDVRPLSIASMVPNAAAGRLAIEHGISGPNTTVAAGRISGLHALTIGARFLRTGHAHRAVVGAVEELSAERLMGDRLTRERDRRLATPATEGCVLALLDHGEGSAGPWLLGARYGAVNGSVSGQRDLLARIILEVLRANDVLPDAVRLVSMSQSAAHSSGIAEQEAVMLALGRRPEQEVVVSELLGDTYSAAAAFQVAAVLANGEGLSLVTVLNEEGQVAAMLLRHGAEGGRGAK